MKDPGPITMYQPALPPRAKQREALERLEGRRYFALLMAMRTGKTKVALDDFGRLWAAGKVDDMQVIAPAGVYRTWVGQVETHVGSPLKEQLRVHVWDASETSRGHQIALEDFLAYRGPRLLLLNVEALSTVKRARELALKFASQRRVLGVVDESTTIKNYKAKRSKFVVRKLGPLQTARRILTGLVSPTSPLDVYMQFEYLKPGLLGFTDYWNFRSRYAIMVPKMIGGRRIEVVDGYRDEADLRERMQPHSFRVRLEDCYDLPPKTYQVREVPLSDEQARLYREMRDYATAKIAEAEHVTATIVITQMLRLHQILCGHTRTDLGDLKEIPEHRTEAVMEILEEYGPEGKAIIWCCYDQDVQKISAQLIHSYGSGSTARFWGGNKQTREAEEKRFLTDPKCRFMVATPAAGGRGRTWVVADLVVYHSNQNNLEHREQSEERPQGVDKAKSVLYVDLVAMAPWGPTIDHKFLNALRGKIDMAAAINGDSWREWIV